MSDLLDKPLREAALPSYSAPILSANTKTPVKAEDDGSDYRFVKLT